MTAMPDDTFEDALDDDNIIPGIELAKVVRLLGTEDVFELHFANGRVRCLSMAELMSCKRARVEIASGSDEIIPSYKPADWDKIATAIIAEAELDVLPPRVEETKDWIQRYAKRKSIRVNEDDKNELYTVLTNIDGNSGYTWHALEFQQDQSLSPWRASTPGSKSLSARSSLRASWSDACERPAQPARLTATLAGKTGDKDTARARTWRGVVQW